MIDSHFGSPLTDKQAHHGTSGKGSTKGGQCIDATRVVTIDMLPDIALLRIFDFYMDEEWVETWRRLVHVCRNWRNLDFGSPRRLNLRLCCGTSTPVRKKLDVWPPFPIVIEDNGIDLWNVDNLIAALEHNDRICRIRVSLPSPQFKKVLAEMQQPFPELTHLELTFHGETPPVVPVPASFLGGSAPRLQELLLDHIPFPGLPKLLLSATHLTFLSLWNIPDSGYISPEAMVTGLSALIRLERLDIRPASPRYHPDRNSRRPPPLTRNLLPALTWLELKGVGEYLEDLVARIDAPLLDKMEIIFFHQLTFDTPQLTQFISRTPKLKTPDEALVLLSSWEALVILPRTSYDGVLKLKILCERSDWQLSSLAQACSLSFPEAVIPAVEHLVIDTDGVFLDWQDDIENSQWLELFHPFTGVKGLYISRKSTPRIAPVLQELVGERVTEVLPALETLFLEETLPSVPDQKAIGQFIAARQLAGHSIAILRWERREEDDSESMYEPDDDD